MIVNKRSFSADKYSVLAVSLISAGLLFTSSAFAANLPSPAGTARQNVQTRLQDAKLKACQAREDGIKKRSDQLTKMATNMLEKFDSIAQRVKDYYTSSVVPSGKTVSSYDDLVADISAKKVAVQTALIKAQNDVTSFNCDDNDPKGQMMTFREDMQGVKQELKDYRTSIKDLIVAVHSVTGVENKQDESSKSGEDK